MGAPLEVPVLLTHRFRLRAWSLDDLPLVQEAGSDPYIPKITTVPADYTDEAGQAFLQQQWDRATTGEGYPFVIAELATDRAVGAIGLWLQDIDAGRASIWYWVAPSARGRSTAQETLQAVREWAFRTLRIPRLELYVEPWNEASIRSAERAGFQREGLMRSWDTVGGERRDMFMYSALESESTPPT
jgi:ribosomal-protein-alanine N-acetyltransferase